MLGAVEPPYEQADQVLPEAAPRQPDAAGQSDSEVRSLTTQFATHPPTVQTQPQDAVVADDEDDDPLSRALRQAVEEGDASVRRWW